MLIRKTLWVSPSSYLWYDTRSDFLGFFLSPFLFLIEYIAFLKVSKSFVSDCQTRSRSITYNFWSLIPQSNPWIRKGATLSWDFFPAWRPQKLQGSFPYRKTAPPEQRSAFQNGPAPLIRTDTFKIDGVQIARPTEFPIMNLIRLIISMG